MFYYYNQEHLGNNREVVDAGADVNAENNYGVSPLKLAKTIADFPYLDLLENRVN